MRLPGWEYRALYRQISDLTAALEQEQLRAHAAERALDELRARLEAAEKKNKTLHDTIERLSTRRLGGASGASSTAATLATGDELPGGLARALRAAREHQGHTLRHVEQETGVHNAHLSQIERGVIEKPSLDVLLPLAAFYRLNAALLAEWAGYSPAVVALLAAGVSGGTSTGSARPPQPPCDDPYDGSAPRSAQQAPCVTPTQVSGIGANGVVPGSRPDEETRDELERRVGRLEEALAAEIENGSKMTTQLGDVSAELDFYENVAYNERDRADAAEKRAGRLEEALRAARKGLEFVGDWDTLNVVAALAGVETRPRETQAEAGDAGGVRVADSATSGDSE